MGVGSAARGCPIDKPPRLEHHSRVAMRSFDIDPEQAVSIVAILEFITAAFIGFPLLGTLVSGDVGLLTLLYAALVAALIVGGVGLLRGERWGWFVSMGAICFNALLDLATLSLSSLLGLLIDGLVIYLLTRPSLRARFGVR
jgi:ribose/xylose/arabinose/galactoside ABC-type transport system permease subunit